MTPDDLKSTFDSIARNYDFQKVGTFWAISSHEGIVTLDLQRSSHSPLYYLNISIFVDRLFDKKISLTKYLIKQGTRCAFRRAPNEFDKAFDIGNDISDSARAATIGNFFEGFLSEFLKKALSITGIIELGKTKQIFVTSSVESALLAIINKAEQGAAANP